MIRHWSTITRATLAVMVAAMPFSGTSAQRAEHRFDRPSREVIRAAVDTAGFSGRRVTGGILGAVGGTVIGAIVGYNLERNSGGTCYDWCGLAGGLLGATIGEGIGFGLGSHASAPPRRPLAVQLLLSTLVSVGGVVVAIGAESAVPLLFVLPVQIGTLGL